MGFQRGPGEGYMMAKDDALALDPTLRCKSLRPYRLTGYAIVDKAGKRIAYAREARSAWAIVLHNMRQRPKDKGEGNG